MMGKVEAPAILETRFQFRLGTTPEVLAVGKSVSSLLGFTSEDFLNARVSLPKQIHPDDQDTSLLLFSTENQQESAGTCNLRIRHADGRIRCIRALYKKTAAVENILDLCLQDAKTLPRAPSNTALTANFQAMMENTDDFIYFKDRNHVFTGASQTLVALCEPAEHWTDLLGQTDYDLFSEEYADTYYRLEKQVFANIAVAREVQKIVKKTGQKGWVDNRKYPIHNDSGEIIGLFGIARDITSQHHLKSTLAAIADFVSNDNDPYNFDTIVAFVAQLFEVDYVHIALLETTPSQVRVIAAQLDGQSIPSGQRYSLHSTPCNNVVTGKVRACYSEQVQLEFPEDQDLITLEAEGYIGEPVFDNNQQVIGLIVLVSRQVLTDSESIAAGLRIISAHIAGKLEQGKSRQALRESERRFRNLFEHTPAISVQGYDSERRVIFWNQASAELYGYSHQEAMGQKLEDLIIPQVMRQEVISAVNAWVAGGPAIPAGELTLQRKDGAAVEVFSSHIMQGGPAGPEMYCIDIDLTELHRTEAALKQKNKEMEQFVYTVSHDLKSPLVTIKTFLGMLREDLDKADNERIRQDLEYISRATDKVEQLLDALLQLSRVGRRDNPPKETSFKNLVVDSLNSTAGSIQRTNTEIEIIEADSLLYGDPLYFGQIWQNLIENAIKYMGEQPRPRITLGAEQRGSETIFFVRDNGMGITPDNTDRIFSIFTQLDPTAPGSGLGLALVKKIVEVYQGRIWVESGGIGQGSCFYFTLPRALTDPLDICSFKKSDPHHAGRTTSAWP